MIKMKMDKPNKVINIAMEKYKPAAAEKIQDTLCSVCPDRRCERGERCNTYALLVKAQAWAMVPSKDN